MDWKALVGHKSFEELLADALNRLRASGSKITNLNPGGVFRTLAELSIQGVADLYDLLAEVVRQGFAAHATGAWLDLKCLDVGISRRPATKTEGLVVFGREQAGSPVVVPAGSIVKTGLSPQGEELRYFVSQDTVIPAEEKEHLVPVRAEFPGSRYNVGPGYITTLVTYIQGVDYVRNDEGWITSEGADEEDDESLRQRYFLRWQELAQGGTKQAYISWAMQVPGVVDVSVNDAFPRGPGTVDVIIVGPDGLPTQALIDAVAAYIEQRRPLCANVVVKGPVLVPADVAVSLTVNQSYGEPAAVEAEATSRVRALFGLEAVPGVARLRIGETLYRSRLVALLAAIPHVLSVDVTSPPEDVVVRPDEIVALGQLGVTVR